MADSTLLSILGCVGTWLGAIVAALSLWQSWSDRILQQSHTPSGSSDSVKANLKIAEQILRSLTEISSKLDRLTQRVAEAEHRLAGIMSEQASAVYTIQRSVPAGTITASGDQVCRTALRQ